MKRPAVVRGADSVDGIAIRHLVELVLSYDHCLIDGADGARYLTDVKKRLVEADFASNLQR